MSAAEVFRRGTGRPGRRYDADVVCSRDRWYGDRRFERFGNTEYRGRRGVRNGRYRKRRSTARSPTSTAMTRSTSSFSIRKRKLSRFCWGRGRCSIRDRSNLDFLGPFRRRQSPGDFELVDLDDDDAADAVLINSASSAISSSWCAAGLICVGTIPSPAEFEARALTLADFDDNGSSMSLPSVLRGAGSSGDGSGGFSTGGAYGDPRFLFVPRRRFGGHQRRRPPRLRRAELRRERIRGRDQ